MKKLYGVVILCEKPEGVVLSAIKVFAAVFGREAMGMDLADLEKEQNGNKHPILKLDSFEITDEFLASTGYVRASEAK